MNILQRFSSQSGEIQWAIIWWITWWFFSFCVWLVIAFYTTGQDWRKEKYFNLQRISEEIITSLRNWHDNFTVYQGEKDILNDQWDVLKGWIGYGEYKHEQRHMERYNLQSNKVDSLAELKQKNYDNALSKIKIYFSEYWLTKVRDESICLNNLVVSHHLSEDQDEKNKIESDIRETCRTIEELIVIKIKRMGRSWYVNCAYRLIEKYNTLPRKER